MDGQNSLIKGIKKATSLPLKATFLSCSLVAEDTVFQPIQFCCLIKKCLFVKKNINSHRTKIILLLKKCQLFTGEKASFPMHLP